MPAERLDDTMRARSFPLFPAKESVGMDRIREEAAASGRGVECPARTGTLSAANAREKMPARRPR